MKRQPVNLNCIRLCVGILIGLLTLQVGCAQIRLPAIDPSGNNIFLPGQGTQLLTPGATSGSLLGINPLRRNQAAPNQIFQPQPFNPQPQFNQPTQPFGVPSAPLVTAPPVDNSPAFAQPATPPPCDADPNCKLTSGKKKKLTPTTDGSKSPGQVGQIVMTPSRIVAPVGAEVVVLAGICGPDGFFLKNQPLEWMLSNNSVGELVEIGGQNHPSFNQLIPPTSKKFSGQYAHGRTGLKRMILSRGTPSTADDIELAQGQTFASVSSASPGTTYITAIAPNAEGWDRRRASTIIHWVDGQWAIPVPSRATAGTVFPLTTVVNRTDSGGGIKGWDVRYSIVGGAPAEFAPTGSQTAETTTDGSGQATVQLRQPAGQFEPGTTQVRVDIVRPPIFGEQELVVESGITSVTWSAPALTIRAIGPREAEFEEPFNYRVEVTNPGDQVARNVVVRTKDLDDSVEYISSTPKPNGEYGRQYEWQLGDIAPGSPAKVIDVQMRSRRRGNVGLCFEVLSETDRLQTEACAETEIVLPCIGFNVDGPAETLVGNEVSFDLVIENQCNEPLEDIEVVVNYDPNLIRPGKSNPAVFKSAGLPFGESRTLRLDFIAQAPGTRCFEVTVSARGVNPIFERRCVIVRDAVPGSPTQPPVLQPGSGSNNSDPNSPLLLEIFGGQATEVNGSTTVEAQITNQGNVPIDAVTLTNRFSPSLDPRGISPNFQSATTLNGNDLLVDIGRINPGQTVPVQVGYVARQADNAARSEFTATSASGPNASAAINIQIAPAGTGVNVPDFGITAPPTSGGPIGIPNDGFANQQPNLELRIRSLNPTIRVGERAEFEISITNNGSQPLNDVLVGMIVPNTLRYFSSDASQAGNLQFLPTADLQEFDVPVIRTLVPNETLTWRNAFQALQSGQATIEARAKSRETVGIINQTDMVAIQP